MEFSVLCECRLNNSYTAVRERERERGHFRNQLARPLTMNNWSELIKICRDYLSPPQQIKHHTCICCLFTHSPPFSSSSHSNMFQLAACCHSEQWNLRHFNTTSCWNLNGITATSFCNCVVSWCRIMHSLVEKTTRVPRPHGKTLLFHICYSKYPHHIWPATQCVEHRDHVVPILLDMLSAQLTCVHKDVCKAPSTMRSFLIAFNLQALLRMALRSLLTEMKKEKRVKEWLEGGER